MAAFESEAYPARLSIDYPTEPLDRLSTAFRIIWIIPIAIILGLLTDGFSSGSSADSSTIAVAGGGGVFLPTVLMLVFRRKYPRWWFDFSLELARFGARVSTYFALMTDKYPSTTEEQAVHLEVDYPEDASKLNRWLPLVKWLLAIPHWIILFFLFLAAIVVIVIAWFAILFTGNYPRGLFNFVQGVGRWSLRVQAYAILLVTDKYPPFSFE